MYKVLFEMRTNVLADLIKHFTRTSYREPGMIFVSRNASRQDRSAEFEGCFYDDPPLGDPEGTHSAVR